MCQGQHAIHIELFARQNPLLCHNFTFILVACFLHFWQLRGICEATLLDKLHLMTTHADTLSTVDASPMSAGYAGDVWDPQPPPEDHPWRKMPNHGMTPHYSGTTLDAQVLLLKTYL